MTAIGRFTVHREDAALACARFGSGEPLLCAHALGFSKEYFVAAADVLGSRFDCVAVDQRGHGETSVGADGAYRADVMAEDLRAVLDHLGWQSAAAAGTSLGAATTLTLALRHPERVSLLIQDLPGFGPTSAHDPQAVDAIARALEEVRLEEAAHLATRRLPPTRAPLLARLLLDQWQPFALHELGPKLAAAFRSTTVWRIVERWPDDLAAVTAPTHVLGLAADRMHPIAVAETMARALPRARLWHRVPSVRPDAVARQWLRVAASPISPHDE